jgi:glycosyltransferase involved in cell wall biosynthesis
VNVLFCCNELARTGAPLVFADLLPLLSADIRPTVYSPHDGPLRRRFEALGPVTTDLSVDGHDLVVVNTVVLWEVVERAVRHGRPVVWVIQESDPSYFGVPARVADTLAGPRAVIFPSRPTASVYARYCRDRTVVIPFPIAPPVIRDRNEARDRLGFRPDETVALCVGTVEARKNQRDLVEAVRDLPMTAVVVGRVAHPDQLAHAPANLRAEGEVADPSWHYAAADVFVSCSTIEALPRVHMEAAANRLPIITTPCFGVRDMIRDGENGLFYRAGRPADLRQHLLRVSEPGFRDRYAKPLFNLPTPAEAAGRFEAVLRAASG